MCKLHEASWQEFGEALCGVNDKCSIDSLGCISVRFALLNLEFLACSSETLLGNIADMVNCVT